MKIQLSQDEIAQAVREYVSKGVTLSNGSQMDVDFSMGRGDNGLSATIDVPYMGVSSLPVTPTTIAAVIPVAAVAPAPAAAAPTPVVSVAQANVAADEPRTDEAAGETPVSGRSLFSTGTEAG